MRQLQQDKTVYRYCLILGLKVGNKHETASTGQNYILISSIEAYVLPIESIVTMSEFISV